VQGSGFVTLDNEVLELVGRAQPFPAPPPELRGDTVTLTVPVMFRINSPIVDQAIP
jgi:protein TonB